MYNTPSASPSFFTPFISLNFNIAPFSLPILLKSLSVIQKSLLIITQSQPPSDTMLNHCLCLLVLNNLFHNNLPLTLIQQTHVTPMLLSKLPFETTHNHYSQILLHLLKPHTFYPKILKNHHIQYFK